MGGGPLVSSAFLTSSTSSEPYADPLASSMPNPSGGSYGDVDPWSSAPSPVMSGTPRRDSVEGVDVPVPAPATVGSSGTGSREGLNGLISEFDDRLWLVRGAKTY